MNWGIVATIAEVVSAIAVVVSLIYLALQIRQSNLESQSAALYQFIDTQGSANLGIIENSEVSELIDRANTDFSSLSSLEVIRLQFVFYNHFNQWLYAFEIRKKTLIDENLWDGILRGYSLLLESSPAFERMWDICGSVYPTEFVDHVDKIKLHVDTK